jgi:hypothetical protein
MRISVLRSDNLVFMDLTPENQAEVFHLEGIKKACEGAKVIHSESRQWSIEGLRILLMPQVKNEA